MAVNTLYTIAEIAGRGSAGDGGLATSASLYPAAIALDGSGNLYIADSEGEVVRMVPNNNGSFFGQSMTANFIYTIAGIGMVPGYAGDRRAATSALLNFPGGVTLDSSGNLYIADTQNNRIQVVPKSSGTYFGQSMTANAIYTAVGGLGPNAGHSGIGTAATSALLNTPTGVAMDSQNNLYIADYFNDRIQMVPKSSGTYFGQSMTGNAIYTIAGNSITSGTARGWRGRF